MNQIRSTDASMAVGRARVRLGRAAVLDPAMWRRDEGQATVEYALVVLGAAAIALLLIAWAARSGKIGELLDKVFDQVVAKAT